MGQQQLLLLILGVIIVSTATIYGIQAFDENRLKSREDNERLAMMDLASRAQSWKVKPEMMGGGLANDPTDFSAFTVEAIGLTPTGGPDSSPYVDIPGAGCFRFLRYSSYLRINALNEECVLGSWTKGILISGPEPEDLSWEFRNGE